MFGNFSSKCHKIAETKVGRKTWLLHTVLFAVNVCYCFLSYSHNILYHNMDMFLKKGRRVKPIV